MTTAALWPTYPELDGINSVWRCRNGDRIVCPIGSHSYGAVQRIDRGALTSYVPVGVFPTWRAAADRLTLLASIDCDRVPGL